MKKITFPESEKKWILERLNFGSNAFTVKPSLNFRRGEFLETTWGDVLQVVDIIKVNGLEDLKDKYKFYTETRLRAPEAIWAIEECHKIDILELKRVNLFS